MNDEAAMTATIKKKTEKTGAGSSESSSSSSFAMEKISCLVSGYFRSYLKTEYKIQARVPSILVTLVYNFYPKIYFYDGKFVDEDETHGRKIEVIDDYNMLMTGYVSSIRLSVGIPCTDVSNYFWFIKISSNSRCNGYHFIGMVPDTTSNFNDAAYDGLNHAYGVSGNSNIVFRGKGTESVNDWGFQVIDQTVKIEFNGTTKVMRFKIPELKGNQILYSIQLPLDLENVHSWFPCISVANHGNTAQIFTHQEIPHAWNDDKDFFM